MVSSRSIIPNTDDTREFNKDQASKSRSLWIFFMLDILLWIFTLICFVTIFTGGGLFLLLVFLLGTGVRVYIVFMLHEFMVKESKIHEKKAFSIPSQQQVDLSRISSAQLEKEASLQEDPVIQMKIENESRSQKEERANKVVAFDGPNSQIETVSIPAKPVDRGNEMTNRVKGKNELGDFLDIRRLSVKECNDTLPGSNSNAEI
jgi:hypothetical protein